MDFIYVFFLELRCVVSWVQVKSSGKQPLPKVTQQKTASKSKQRKKEDSSTSSESDSSSEEEPNVCYKFFLHLVEFHIHVLLEQVKMYFTDFRLSLLRGNLQSQQ